MFGRILIVGLAIIPIWVQNNFRIGLTLKEAWQFIKDGD